MVKQSRRTIKNEEESDYLISSTIIYIARLINLDTLDDFEREMMEGTERWKYSEQIVRVQICNFSQLTWEKRVRFPRLRSLIFDTTIDFDCWLDRESCAASCSECWLARRAEVTHDRSTETLYARPPEDDLTIFRGNGAIDAPTCIAQ